MSIEVIVRDLRGYEEEHPDPQSRAGHVAREATLESEFFERETREGKNPNPTLCHICRKIEVLMRDEASGALTWNKKLFLPHGNWN